MVPPRSCFRIAIPGPARGAQALFTVGPALILSAREVFFIPVRDPGGDAPGTVRALPGGGCGTTRGTGRWKRAAGTSSGRNRTKRCWGLLGPSRGWGAAERRHASAKRSIFLTKSAQLRQLSAGGRAGERPSRPGADFPHAPAPSAAQLGTRAAAAPIPALSRPAGARGRAGAPPGAPVPRDVPSGPGRAGSSSSEPPAEAPSPDTAAGLRLRVRAAPGPPLGPRRARGRPGAAAAAAVTELIAAEPGAGRSPRRASLPAAAPARPSLRRRTCPRPRRQLSLPVARTELRARRALPWAPRSSATGRRPAGVGPGALPRLSALASLRRRRRSDRCPALGEHGGAAGGRSRLPATGGQDLPRGFSELLPERLRRFPAAARGTGRRRAAAAERALPAKSPSAAGLPRLPAAPAGLPAAPRAPRPR